MSTVVPLHAGRLPPTAVLHSLKQFADQLFFWRLLARQTKGLQNFAGKNEMYRRRKTGGVMPLKGKGLPWGRPAV
ncbi:hypothetical protein, partial [Pseudomonas corrugata]